MGKVAGFRFKGTEDTWAQMPDQSVVYAEPGKVYDLPYTDPGPLWEAVRTKDQKNTPDTPKED